MAFKVKQHRYSVGSIIYFSIQKWRTFRLLLIFGKIEINSALISKRMCGFTVQLPQQDTFLLRFWRKIGTWFGLIPLRTRSIIHFDRRANLQNHVHQTLKLACKESYSQRTPNTNSVAQTDQNHRRLLSIVLPKRYSFGWDISCCWC